MNFRKTIREDLFFAWNEFERACKDHPIPTEDCIYALPLELIDLIHDFAPDFWSGPQFQFEQNLSAISGGIFLAKQQVLRDIYRPFILLSDFYGTRTESPRQKAKKRPLITWKSDALDVSETELQTAGYSPTEVKTLQCAMVDHRGKNEQLGIGFAGWLITNAQFLAELRQLKSQAPAGVGNGGRFPILQGGFSTGGYETLGRTFKGIWSPQNDQDRNFDKDCQDFLQRWCLQSLLTWDIPVPMETSMGTTASLLTRDTEAGVHVFVPWYALKAKEKKLDTLLRVPLAKQMTANLSSWLRKGSAEKGAVRYSRLFRLFVYWVCALERRYGEKIAKYRPKLELAFLTYFKLGKVAKESKEREITSCDSVIRLLRAIKKAHTMT